MFEPKIDGGEDSARDGQQMRGELNLIGRQMELFEQLAGVAMAEDGVCGEVVGGVHEMSVRGWSFAGSADSGLGIADDAVLDIDEARLNQRRESRG